MDASWPSLLQPLEQAVAARRPLLDENHQAALRLFNGFIEGYPDLTLDLYGRTLLAQNHAEDPASIQGDILLAVDWLRGQFPWLAAGVVKQRRSPDPEMRRGALAFGERPDRKVREGGVWYALDLLLHQDATLYLDTRTLRAWARERLAGMRVLNTFAYTGSLGVAALAGGAARVVQLDLNRTYLNLAKDSYSLNGFPIVKADFIEGDFWSRVNGLKRQGVLFDCVFLDPPFFSVTGQGTVDLVSESRRVINKVRPLVADGGLLVSINNALFLSGQDYLTTLEALAADGYLSIEELIPVPEDCTGYPHTRRRPLPADPAPFNHSTKIAVLRVRRKGG